MADNRYSTTLYLFRSCFAKYIDNIMNIIIHTIIYIMILINMFRFFIPVVHGIHNSNSRCCCLTKKMKQQQHNQQVVSIIMKRSTSRSCHISSRSASSSNYLNHRSWFGSIIHNTQRQNNKIHMKYPTSFCYVAVLQRYKKFDIMRRTSTTVTSTITTLQLYRNQYNNNKNNIPFISRYSNSFHSLSSSSEQEQQQQNNQHHIQEHDDTADDSSNVVHNNDNNNTVGNVLMKTIKQLEQYQIEYNNNNKMNSNQISNDIIDVSLSSLSVQSDHQLLDIEPISSTIHLLAHAMKLPWDTGYRDLYHILEQTNTPIQQQTLEDNKKDNDIVSKYTILTTEQIQLFESYIYRRMILLEPIQYIIGQWDFLQYQIKICKPLLCPRPETEELVDLIIQDIKTVKKQKQSKISSASFLTNNNNIQFDNQINILDIGCGTGCIGIALCDMILNSNVIAIDIEPIAINVSNYNGNQILLSSKRNRYHTILCSIEEYDGTNANKKATNNGTDNTNNNNLFHIIVSNPPYILKNDISNLSPIVINHESINALSDNNSIDGMDVIRTIINKLPYLCYHNALCYIEVDPTQPQLIQQYIEQLSSNVNRSNIITTSKKSNNNNNNNNKYVQYVSTHQDMMGRDRFVKLIVLDRDEKRDS